MWARQGSNKPTNVSDRSQNVQEGSTRNETWKNEKGGKEMTSDFSVYDSGQTDSGFLSGANILSETYLSGEITPPSPTPGSSDAQSESNKYMRLDSGVDVGLSEQFSDLCLEESSRDLSSETKLRQTCEAISSASSIHKTAPQSDCEASSEESQAGRVPWELYFQQDEEGDTQLHIAIIQGFVEVVFSLVRMVPNPSYLDIRNDMRQTGLHLAVLTSQPKILRRLVCAGARTDIVDRNGNTALHLATTSGELACVRALTDPITVAETQAAGLQYSLFPRQPRPPEIDMCNYEGLTCVHLAVMGSSIDILRHLYWLGADINAREWKSGRTALHLAVESGDERVATVLVRDMQAQPSARTYSGHSVYRLLRRNPKFSFLNGGALHESDYSSSEDEEEDESDSELQMLEPTFRDLHTNGGIVNATA